MNWLKKLAQLLFFRRSQITVTGDPLDHPVDMDKIAKELNIEEDARRLGEANLPDCNEKSLSGIETKIIQRVEKVRQHYLAWAAERLRVLNQEIHRQDVSTVINKANQLDREFERKASEMLSKHEETLKTLDHTIQQRQKQLSDFRADHQLSRTALYPTRHGKFLKISLLILLIVIEGAANAVFFAEGVSNGYIGGFIYAAGFSLLNIFFAGFWGSQIRNLNHRHVFRKTVGVLSGILASIMATGIAFLIAHFRDALKLGVDDASRIALESLKGNPFALNDVLSWLLFGLTLLSAVIALYDVYSLDDPYPGYGKLDRLSKQASQDYADELDFLREQLQELKDEILQELDNAIDDSKNSLSTIKEWIETKVSTEIRLQHSEADVENCMTGLIQSFRDFNKLQRKTPYPSYFDEPVPLKPLNSPNFSVHGDRKKLTEQETLVQTLLDKVETIRANIQLAFNRTHDTLIPLTEHFDSTRPFKQEQDQWQKNQEQHYAETVKI